MKPKTIKAVIRKKLDEWLESIEDATVKELARNETIVTGGCIASMLLKEPVNDFDIYFRTRKTTEAVAKYYVEQFKKNPPARNRHTGDKIEIWVDTTLEDRITIQVKSAGIAGEQAEGKENYAYFEADPDADGQAAADFISDTAKTVEAAEEDKGKKYRPVFLTYNAITLTQKIQIVCRFYGEPDEIHENYDFQHCMCYYTSWDSNLVLRPKSLETLLSRELVYIGSKYPICSMIRTRKFIQRGWTINAGQYVKMAWQIGQLDLNDMEVMRDQLTGVDTAYFKEIIDLLKQKDSARVDGTYLFQLIDRIF